MNWSIFGARATMAANDPQVGDKFLNTIIVIACFFLSMAGTLILAANQGQDGRYYNQFVQWTVLLLNLVGVIGVVYVMFTIPLMEATNWAVIIGPGFFVLSFLLIKVAVKQKTI